ETSGLTERVHLVGQREYAQPYYLASDVFILTSREDPFPCVVHEAMACALPVVAFQGSGGAPEALDKGAGVIVKYRDLDGMAQQILRLLLNPGEAHRIGEIARQRVADEYDFGNYVRRLARMVREDLGVPLKIERLQPKVGSSPRVLFFNRDWWISGAN